MLLSMLSSTLFERKMRATLCLIYEDAVVLRAAACRYVPSPAQVASSCDVTFAMLADPQSAAEVACGAGGAAEGLAPGKGYVDVSTIDGATSKLIGERITSTGASFLEVVPGHWLHAIAYVL